MVVEKLYGPEISRVLRGKVKHELRVQIHELRVQMYELRVQIHELKH